MSKDSNTVSICMITYNHEPYIHQAIEGVLMQKCNLNMELVIGEDYSKDKTRNICNEYAVNNSLIRLLPSVTNMGMMQNFIRTIQACTGKYIALCEGDDYWTDPYKLQKQVDFLESNPDYAICGSIAKMFYQETKEEKFEGISGDFTIQDLAGHIFVPTLTSLFRREYTMNLPDWFVKCPYGDKPLFLWIAQFGKIKIFKEAMAVHRIHMGGIWTKYEVEKTWEKQWEMKVDLLTIIADKFDPYTNALLQNELNKYCIKLANYYLQAEEYTFFKIWMIKYLGKKVDSNESVELINSIIAKYENQEKEIKKLVVLNKKIKDSSSYRIGNKIVRFLNLFNPVKVNVLGCLFIYKLYS